FSNLEVFFSKYLTLLGEASYIDKAVERAKRKRSELTAAEPRKYHSLKARITQSLVKNNKARAGVDTKARNLSNTQAIELKKTKRKKITG
ncbi:hypothetical protein H6F77_26995, partial [Microcoleus sp. FACHB-831]|uniref:hypothetical protein n=1 Tax=Microcoleus sp. FACHB-831 TaxID=2692827 RepID=UPI00198616E4